MKNNEPLVSIVIPCYNHEDFVQDSIQSVIEQTYENIELIIIDDGSKDGSVAKIQQMIESCEQRFVRFEFRSRPNKGLSATLNEAIEWCQGKYFAALASDDVILENKTKIQVKFLEEHKDILAVFGGVKSINENNKELKVSLGEAKLYNFKRIIMHKYDLPAPTQMMRLESVIKIGGYDSHIIIEDWYMWLKLSRWGGVFYMNEIFALYRQHDNNISKNLEKMQKGRIDVINCFKSSEYYNKAMTNIKWINAREDYENSKKEKVVKFLILLYIKPFKTANFIFKKFIKKIKIGFTLK